MFWPNRTSFDLPMSPNLDKELFPAFCMLIVLAIKAGPVLARAQAHRSYERLLVIAALGAIGTVVTNTDDLVYGPNRLLGLKINDLVYYVIEVWIRWLPPFLLGHALFRRRADLEDLFRFMVGCGLVYSLFILVEIRLSPQLHNWIYGFHQHYFMQSIRMGGYRPIVFMRHGLNVAFFIVMCLLAATALYKANVRLRLPVPFFTPKRTVIYLAIILAICKSTGAYFYGILALPLLLFGPIALQRAFATALIVVVMIYPILRSVEAIPVDDILDWIRINVAKERAASLGFRFHNEAEILENTRERIWFGWGYNARPFEHDIYSGEMTTVVDGAWIIELSAHGIVGFLSLFLMLVLPIVQAVRAIPKLQRKSDRQLLSALTVMCAIYMIEWIPNSPASAELTMLVGALAGVAPGMLREQRARRRAERREARRREARAGRR